MRGDQLAEQCLKAIGVGATVLVLLGIVRVMWLIVQSF